MEALRRAIALAGSQKKLAVKLGVPQTSVSYWLRKGRVPEWRVAGIVKATRGRVKAAELSNPKKETE